MADKEATARIKINRLLEAAGWRFFPQGSASANVRLEPRVTIKSSDLDALGENLGVFVYRREKDHSRVTAVKHIAKRNPFAPNVLQQQKWRKSGLRPAVATLETFATRALWLMSIRTFSACTEGAR